jgi:hypothetical protein
MYRPPKRDNESDKDYHGRVISENESGVAYGWLIISLFLVIAAVLYVIYLGVINSLLDGPQGDQSIGINHDIKAGKQSVQSRNAIQFNTSMATNIPFFVITGAFVFAISRAIVVKRVP